MPKALLEKLARKHGTSLEEEEKWYAIHKAMAKKKRKGKLQHSGSGGQGSLAAYASKGE